MTIRYRPIAPVGYFWTAKNELLAECGCLEFSVDVSEALQAQAALQRGAPVIDGAVEFTIRVPVEAIECPD